MTSSTEPSRRPGEEADPEALALYDALVLVAGTSGATTLPFTDVVRDGGAADAFALPGGGLDTDRVEAVAASLVADGFLARRGAAGIAPVRRPGSAAGWQGGSLSASDPDLEPVEDDELIDEDETDDAPPPRAATRTAPARPSGSTTRKASSSRGATSRTGSTVKSSRSTSGRAATKSSGSRKPAAATRGGSGAARPSRATGAAPTADALAGGLSSLLTQVDEQVSRVSALSERIDDLVTDLNAARAEQAARWTALAQLREVAYDAGLGEVLDPRLAAQLPSVDEDPFEPLG